MDFRRRPFNQKPLVFRKIQGPIWRSKDHLVMKELSKNVKNHEISRFHNSVRQKIGDAGSISTQNIFPLSSVVSKPPQLPYAPWGPKKGIQKEAILSNNDEFWCFCSFPEKYFCWGHFWKYKPPGGLPGTTSRLLETQISAKSRVWKRFGRFG